MDKFSINFVLVGISAGGEMEKKVAEVVELINNVAEDTSVPKNIRRALVEARERLKTYDEIST